MGRAIAHRPYRLTFDQRIRRGSDARRRLLFLAPLLVSILLVAACAEEVAPTAAPTPTPAPPPTGTPTPTPTSAPAPTPDPAADAGQALRERLRTMALPSEALPEDLALQSADFTTNQEAASDDPQGTEAALANLQRWGRLLGYRVRYASQDALGVFRTGGLLAIVARVVEHRDPAGAEAAFQDWERKLQDPAYLNARLTARPGATLQRFQPLPAAAVADRSLAVDAILSIQAPEGTSPFTTRFYLFQEGPIMGLLELFYVGEPAPLEELEGLVGSFHARVLAALDQP